MAILTIDQGTTGTTILLVDKQGTIISRSYHEFPQHFPQPGWVEHDALEIWETVVEGIGEILDGYSGKIEAIGITNQRETTVIWDADTGIPIYRAIVWQCRRTASMCQALSAHESNIRAKTGLPLDAYFSGTKARWILDHAQPNADQSLLFGTIDTWLIWKLTGGKIHATDHTNASRTMLYNIHQRQWDQELCDLIGVPLSIMPDVLNSCDDFGSVKDIEKLDGVPIRGVAGDQQASLFGQQCFQEGQAKNTYGTGCFIMMNTGAKAVASSKGLITTLAADPEGKPCYALEGSIFIAGAAIQWLRDELKIIEKASESEAAALAVEDNGGVYLVPAFVGLGAPHWDMEARGIITGLTRGSNRNHIIRAALESMAYQTRDVVKIMEQETGSTLEYLAVDGGATSNDFLMQFQSDMLQFPVFRSQQLETTALGAAYLAGLGVGFWDKASLKALGGTKTEFKPNMPDALHQTNLRGWQIALKKAMCR